MSTFAAARYAIWQHGSQHLQGQLEWRVTPRSKQLVGIVPAVRLSGFVTVTDASCTSISLQLDAQQASDIADWLSGLPPEVIRSTAETDHCICHQGPYLRLDRLYQVTEHVPQAGDRVAVRLTASVSAIGPLRKAHVVVTDIYLADVTA